MILCLSKQHRNFQEKMFLALWPNYLLFPACSFLVNRTKYNKSAGDKNIIYIMYSYFFLPGIHKYVLKKYEGPMSNVACVLKWFKTSAIQGDDFQYGLTNKQCPILGPRITSLLQCLPLKWGSLWDLAKFPPWWHSRRLWKLGSSPRPWAGMLEMLNRLSSLTVSSSLFGLFFMIFLFTIFILFCILWALQNWLAAKLDKYFVSLLVLPYSIRLF